jgi:hypothetical protein
MREREILMNKLQLTEKKIQQLRNSQVRFFIFIQQIKYFYALWSIKYSKSRNEQSKALSSLLNDNRKIFF